ncbi:MAG: beta strand repeat-containing protein [Janthinobacterium lividum]
MAVKVWNGSSDIFENAADWTPASVPVAGDTATINSGIVTETGTFADSLTLSLNASSADGGRLVLSGATLPATLRLDINGSGTSAAVQVQGQVSNLGTITVTSSGSGSATFLVQNATDGSDTTFANAGTIAVTDGTAQFFDFGGNATKMTNNGVLSVASTGAAASLAYTNLPTDGTGSVVIGSNSVAEFAASVGTGQTVTFQPGNTSGTLKLDSVGAFQGSIKGLFSGDQIVFGGVAAPSVSYTSTSATSGVLQITSNGTTAASLNVQGVYSTGDFALATTDLGNGQSSTVLTTTDTAPAFGYTDTTTSTAGTVTPDLYSGPVSYLQYQYIWGSADNVAISANRNNAFLHGGTGDDALAANGGSNVLDGGTGSNFLVGGTGSDGGNDTFFVDGRASTVTNAQGAPVTWDTLVNFHHGDALTMFGFTAGVSTSPLSDGEGAAGYTGVTIHSELGGAGTGVNGSVTFAGISLAQAQANFSFSYGTTNAGDNYMQVTYTGNG